MQYCAILSQVHRHKDALIQAKESVKLSHLLINDLKQLCEFYVKREEIDSTILNTGTSRQNIDDPAANYNSYANNSQDYKKLNSSRNRSFSQFLSQHEYFTERNNNSVIIPATGNQLKKDSSS